MTTPATDQTPLESPPTPPLTGTARQLDILARQMLAQRSGLEAIIAATCVTPSPSGKAIASMADSLIDQLDAAFAVLTGLQSVEEMRAAGPTVEGPPAASEPEAPRTFGWRRKKKAAEEAAASVSPSTTTPEGGNSHG